MSAETRQEFYANNAILDKKLEELEAKLSDALAAPFDDRISDDIENLILFLKNLWSAEANVSHSTNPPPYLQHIYNKLQQHESTFRNWQNQSRVQDEDGVDDDGVFSTCSCTESCFGVDDDVIGGEVHVDEEIDEHPGLQEGSLVVFHQRSDKKKEEDGLVDRGVLRNGSPEWKRAVAVAVAVVLCSMGLLMYRMRNSLCWSFCACCGDVLADDDGHYFQVTPT